MTDNPPADISTLKLREVSVGVILPVRAQPGSRRNGITGIHDGRLKVAVTQAAERGKANKELVKVLASTLDVSRNRITLESGELSPLKEFLIQGLTADELRSYLRAILER